MKRNIGKPFNILWLAGLLLAAALCTGCAGKTGEKPVTTSFFAMDTIMEMTIYGDESISKEAEELVKALEKKLSATEGEVAELNRANENGKLESRPGSPEEANEKTSFSLSAETGELIEKALKYSRWTDGALDIAIYPITQLYGFDTRNFHVPTDGEISELLQITGADAISLTKDENGGYSASFSTQAAANSGLRGAAIDLGCIAKGYTGDKVAEFLTSKGVESALLNLGGNVCVIGEKPDGKLWRIGVVNPKDTGSQIGYIDVRDCSVVTSGSYQRFFEEGGKRYHHILDPANGKPVNNGLSSVTVIGRDGAMCDALSTALFVAGETKAMEIYHRYSHFDEINVISGNRDPREMFEKNILIGGFEVVFVYEDGTCKITKGLNGVFVPIGVTAVVLN